MALIMPSNTLGNSATIVSFVSNEVLVIGVGGKAGAGADTRSELIVCTVFTMVSGVFQDFYKLSMI